MKRITFLTMLTVLLGLWTIAAPVFIPSEVLGAVPQLINFQGILKDGSGNPVANGPYSVMFKIYDAPTGGNLLWMETKSVTTSSGLFTTLLGSITAIPDTIFNDSSRYLEIKVAADPPMAPRQKLSSVGYSYVSSQWNSAGENLFRLNGNVGVGTAFLIGTSKLNVYNSGSNPFSLIGVRGEANNSSTGDAYGGYFSGSSTSGLSYGVYGSGGYVGVSATGGAYGVEATGGTYGIYGTSSSGNGVYGTSSSAGGVYGYSSSSIGVVGLGATRGVYGSSSGGDGVYGYSSGYNGIGVYGEASNGLSPSGVFGFSSSGYAGTFSGAVYVSGFLSKPGGGFKIDHPLDPANKYLYHSFVESPDMKNIYDGVVVTDAKGNASVSLPDWFGALNRDFRYQLTVIGQFAQAIVSKEIANNQFSIQTDKPNIKVSWQVTGIRQDAWANAHRIPVEEVKPDKERGYYLHPDLFGQPEEKGIEWASHPEMMKEMKERRLQAEREQK